MTHSKIIGIYKITTRTNNKVYIGSSTNIKQRWYSHLNKLRKNIHPNKHLLNAYNLYGEKDLEFSIIEIIQDLKILIEREQYYLDIYLSYDRNIGYNIRTKAETNIGHVVSEETRQKQRISSSGKKHSEETKIKISLANKGKKVSEESKKKISESKKGKPSYWKGKKRSEQQRKKISEHAKTRIGIKNPNSKLSEEDIKEIRRMHKEKILINDIAKKFCVSRSTIKRVAYGQSYNNI